MKEIILDHPNNKGVDLYYSHQDYWAQKAIQLAPKMIYGQVSPIAQIECEKDSTVWQGIKIHKIASAKDALGKWFHCKTFRFDFGQHLVGRIKLELEIDQPNDSPIRIVCKFAEVPYELATNFSTYHGHLDRSWLQKEVRTFDILPKVIQLKRRFAFRYLEIQAGAPNYKTRIKAISVTTESSANLTLPAPETLTAREHLIDKVAVATLHDCMQSVFEDGPKRDRRLWLGDLWLQAKVNACTFQNFKLMERCLYLFCSIADADGFIPGSMFLHDQKSSASCYVITYALLLGPILQDHFAFCKKDEICRELLPVVLRQQEIIRSHIDSKGVLHCASNWWLFIDHNRAVLKTETATLGIYIFSLRKTAVLIRELGLGGAEELIEEAEHLSALIRNRAWDAEQQLMLSDGPEKQVSWATQAWLILAKVPTPDQALAMWKAAWRSTKIIEPKTPYLWSTVMEAGYQLGQYAKVRSFINEYWGGMVDRGADTFWEVYSPKDPFFSSYGDPLMNSACHAWSCIPSYFLRSSYINRSDS